MKHIKVVLVAMALVSMVGCAGMNSQQQKTLSGAGIGAGTGAVLGVVTGGSPIVGGVVGAGVGAAAGYIIGDHDKKK